MTEKQFIVQYRREYNRLAGFSPNEPQEQAARLAAEAAGVKWDPEEEEPLPERLKVGEPGSCIVDPAIHDGNEVILVACGHYAGKPGTGAAMKIAHEAVRRWNAFQAVRELVLRAQTEDVQAEEFLVILDDRS